MNHPLSAVFFLANANGVLDGLSRIIIVCELLHIHQNSAYDQAFLLT